MRKLKDILVKNKIRCVVGIIICITINFLNITSLLLDVTNFYGNLESAGFSTFKLFTTLSNLLISISGILMIPFFIESFRKNDFYLPRWIVDIFYVGTASVILTFLTAITVISFTQGFMKAMFLDRHLYTHTINPLLALIFFVFICPSHNIKFYKTLFGMIPTILYGSLYFVMVVLIGEDNGGWEDYYYFNTYMPWYFSMLIVFSLSFLVCLVLMLSHNYFHNKSDNEFYNYYFNSQKYNVKDIDEAITILCDENTYLPHDAILNIPLKKIRILMKRFNIDEKELDNLASLYLDKLQEKKKN